MKVLHFKKKIIFIASTLVLFLLIIIAVYKIIYLFSIKKIEIIGSPVHLAFDTKIIGMNLFFFPSDSVRSMLLHDYPEIKFLSFEKKFPDTLRVHLDLRQATALIKTRQSTITVSDDGVILHLFSQVPKDIPTIEYDSSISAQMTTVTDLHILSALKFLKITEVTPNFLHIVTSANSIEFTINSTNVIISSEKDIQETYHSLQSLLTGFRIQGRIPKLLDLRFDKPVVLFSD